MVMALEHERLLPQLQNQLFKTPKPRCDVSWHKNEYQENRWDFFSVCFHPPLSQIILDTI